MSIITPPKVRGMRYPNGRHEGVLVETIILKYPDYINWLSERSKHPGFAKLYNHIDKCIDIFDDKPFTNVNCSGKIKDKPCPNPVSRFSLYPNSMSPCYWCATCDPYQQSSTKELTVASDYNSALRHICDTTSGNRDYYRIVIKDLAEAKGYTGSFTEKKVIEFFYGPGVKPRPREEDEGV